MPIWKRTKSFPLAAEEVAVEAAKVDVTMKRKVQGWGLADSIVLSTARNRDGKVVTGDPHFRGLTEAFMI